PAMEFPEHEPRPRSRPDIPGPATDLLEHAADCGLPAPDTARLSRFGQEVSLGFPGHRDTFHTLAQWAERFGGTVTGEPYTRDDGSESVYCQVKFPYQGIAVEAYAFITADEISPA